MRFSDVYDSSYNKSFDAGLKAYMLRIYQYVAAGLLLTSLSAFLTVSFEPLTMMIFNVNNGILYGFTGLGTLLTFAPLFIGIYFFWGFGSMSLEKAKTLFWIYAFTMGVSISSLSIMYTGQSIVRTFFITASAFGAMSLYGYTTKKDLTSVASMLSMVMIGLLVASIINIFIGSTFIYFLTSIVGVVVFMGLIAWNTQKIRQVYYSYGGGSIAQKYAIMSAFQLYLDFVNLFFYLIRFFGDRRN